MQGDVSYIDAYFSYFHDCINQYCIKIYLCVDKLNISDVMELDLPFIAIPCIKGRHADLSVHERFPLYVCGVYTLNAMKIIYVIAVPHYSCSRTNHDFLHQ